MQRLQHQFPLRRGAHDTREDGMCTMEMVAWLAGEAHSDEPRCACPVIAAFVRAVNDALPSDEARDQYLRPLVPRLVNTRAGAMVERRRGFLVADALTREFVPHLLERRGQRDEAAALRALAPVVGVETANAGLRAIEAWAADLHAARWTLQRAAQAGHPARYVAGAVQVLRRAGDAVAWHQATALVRAMCDAGWPETPQTQRDTPANALN